MARGTGRRGTRRLAVAVVMRPADRTVVGTVRSAGRPLSRVAPGKGNAGVLPRPRCSARRATTGRNNGPRVECVSRPARRTWNHVPIQRLSDFSYTRQGYALTARPLHDGETSAHAPAARPMRNAWSAAPQGNTGRHLSKWGFAGPGHFFEQGYGRPGTPVACDCWARKDRGLSASPSAHHGGGRGFLVRPPCRPACRPHLTLHRSAWVRTVCRDLPCG